MNTPLDVLWAFGYLYAFGAVVVISTRLFRRTRHTLALRRCVKAARADYRSWLTLDDQPVCCDWHAWQREMQL